MNVRKLPIACVRSTLDVLLMMNFKMKGEEGCDDCTTILHFTIFITSPHLWNVRPMFLVTVRAYTTLLFIMQWWRRVYMILREKNRNISYKPVFIIVVCTTY